MPGPHRILIKKIKKTKTKTKLFSVWKNETVNKHLFRLKKCAKSQRT